ncbi:MAG: hypothetical protein JXB10_00895, partial [Pirellulales bacterium]|nr:hypothetical protein [Pirellulales bacterium]
KLPRVDLAVSVTPILRRVPKEKKSFPQQNLNRVRLVHVKIGCNNATSQSSCRTVSFVFLYRDEYMGS